jgi:hypothetical protein
MYECGHGSTVQFGIGKTNILQKDANRFQYVNPLYIELSCGNQAYTFPECIDESFLKAPRGPAVIISGPIVGAPWTIPPGRFLTKNESGFWEDLFSGKSIGEAFYNHSKEAQVNPFQLFGDPSIIIFGTV